MRKGRLLNSEIISVISRMGHTDGIAVGDCGLPIPETTQRIDLALENGVPGFIQTLEAIKGELEVEEIMIAKETAEISDVLYQQLLDLFPDKKVTIITHEELKEELGSCKAVVRTGEQTPYANIILKSGVVF